MTRQREWQIKKRAQGLCTICGSKPIVKGIKPNKDRCTKCYKKHLSRVKKNQKKYYEKHKEKIKIKAREYYHRKKKERG